MIRNENIGSIRLWLDDNVHNTYAKELLPRAVGYSAGLLNYFFRGTLEITAPDTYVYSIIDGSSNPQQFTKIKAKVMNTTPNEQIQAGVLQAVAKYKKGQTMHLTYPQTHQHKHQGSRNTPTLYQHNGHYHQPKYHP